MREQLIELFLGWGGLSNCAEDMADYLIANGVTFGKPLTEYLHPIDTYEGLKGKYLVFKADTGEQVVNCFVLLPEKDAAAVDALRAYANTTENKTLAEDIYNWVGKDVTVQQWIPVTERLPENNTRNVVCYIDPIDGEKTVSSDVFWKERWVRFGEYVTHWMPLPEPPKEDAT